MRVLGWLLALALVFGFVTHRQLVAEEAAMQAGVVDCAPADPRVAVVQAVEDVGGAVHYLASENPPRDVVVEETVATLDVVGTWIVALHSAAKGEERPETVSRYEARAVTAHQASLTACAPCPSVQGPAVQPAVAPAGEGREVARAAATAAGFTGPDLEVAVAVAGAESTWRNITGPPNRNGSVDHGMWQINDRAHPEKLAAGDWSDPYDNAVMARQVFVERGNWTAWVAYTNGAYREHLQNAVSGPETVPVAGTTGQGVCAAPGGVLAAAGPSSVPGGRAEPGPWGGHENGRIPQAALCDVQGAPGHRLRCDAATALAQVRAAYSAATGRTIGVTDTYRSYDAQVDVARRKGLYKNGGLAAVPGTSNHGWGLAADLRLDSQALAWMRANAPEFGFEEDTPRETWHWAYYGGQTVSAG